MPLRITTDQPSLVWQGSFFNCHSLSLVNRELVAAILQNSNYELSLQNIDQEIEGIVKAPRFSNVRSSLNRRTATPSLTVRHQWPPDFRRPESGRLALIQPWEFGSVPSAWVDHIGNSVDELWVPSTFVRDCYIESGVSADQVFVIPNGVNIDQFHPNIDPLEISEARGYRFLFVGGTISRKGIDVLLDAYSQAFSSQDDVSLIIKDFGAKSFYAGQDAGALIAALQAKPGAPHILHITEDMSEPDIARLYAACDVLVHPYRGEGFGLPVAEAMACGMPVIVTEGGATRDFVSNSTGFTIPSKKVIFDTKQIGDMATVDFPWWLEPNVEALIDLLRDAVDRQAVWKEVGALASRNISENFTWRHAAESALKRIDLLIQRPTVNNSSASRSMSSANSRYESRKQRLLELVRDGSFIEAIPDAEQCLIETPGDMEVWNAHAVALFRIGRIAEAIDRLTEGLTFAPYQRDLHHNLAFIHLKQGQARLAIEHSVKAFQCNTASAEARTTLTRATEIAHREARRLQKSSFGPARAAGLLESSRLKELVAAANKLLSTNDQSNLPGRPKPLKMPRISVVMIVRNEEEYLRECLESVTGFADEIVIVDTGSTDRTVEIASEFGAKVIQHTWNEDFASARNISLAHATGDWALWLDADERLAKGDGDLLRYLVYEAEPNVGGYMVNIRNFMNREVDPEICWHRACRLFRRQEGIRFTGRIHEQNLRSIETAGYVCALSKLTLDHYGYIADVMDSRNKHDRFIKMLTREIEENPDDTYHSFHLFNLGNAYFTQGDMQKAALWLEKAADEPDISQEYTAILFTEWVTALYADGRHEQALSAYNRAKAAGVEHPSIEFARGHALVHLKRYSEAEIAFRKSINDGKSGMFVHSGDQGAYTYKAWYGLALAATGLDRYEDALSYCQTAVEQNERFADAIYLGAVALRRLNRPHEAKVQLEHILKTRPQHELAQQEYAEVLVACGYYSMALSPLRRQVEANPIDLNLICKLAETCEKLSLFDEMRGLFLRARRLNPSSTAIIVNLGRANAFTTRHSEAFDCYADAIRLDARCANALFNAGDLLYSLENYSKATEIITAALDIEPANAQGLFVLGNCLFRIGEIEKAAECFELVLKGDPDHLNAASNLALVEELLDQMPSAA